MTQGVADDWKALAGEPRGRLVCVERGGWKGGIPQEGSDVVVASYTADPRDGTLTEVSQATVSPRPSLNACGIGCERAAGWGWVRAGANRIHGVYSFRWGLLLRHSILSYVSIPVTADGRLGPVHEQEFGADDPQPAVVDVRTELLYKSAGSHATGSGAGFEVHVIQPDGTLTHTGSSELCQGRPICASCPTFPLAAARGFLFASAYTRSSTASTNVCSYHGLRLDPLAALDLTATAAEVFVPASDAEPVLLAMNVTVAADGGSRQELRTFAMGGDGSLEPRHREALPAVLKQLVFHPTRRFLYVVDTASRLRAYSFDAMGRLELLTSLDEAGSSVAITLKDGRQ